MKPPSPSTAQGEPLGLVIKLPFATSEEFLSKYGVHLTRGGIYLRSKSVKPPGTSVRLEIKLADGSRVIHALAVIQFVTGQSGQGLPGMGFRFLTVDAETQRLLDAAVTLLPHADSLLPPLPAGVGPADASLPSEPGGASGMALEAPSVAPTLLNEPGTPHLVIPAHTPLPGTIPAVTSASEQVSSEAPPPLPAPEPLSSRPPPPAETPPPLQATQDPAPVPSAPVFEAPTEEPKRTGPVIGIDLGTTNSCAAFVRNNKPGVLPSREGHNTVPSIIALNTRGRLVVGHPARGQMLTNPRQTVYGAKRLVGRPYDSTIVQQIRDRFAYEIAPGDEGEAAVRLGDRVYSLQQLSALILREVREVAQNQLGQSVSRAVITVPAYYNDNQRQAVREAGRLAGLYVERILNEPTAAALAYGFGRKLQQRVLVYDLGGGTFDASVLELKDTLYEVVSTGGDTFLGGIDFDHAIVEYLLQQFQERTGLSFQGDRVALQRVQDAAERAKCALSERAEVRVQVAFLMMADGKPVDLDVSLSRDQLVKLTGQLVDRTLQVCAEVMDAKGLTPKDIDEVILVGGQSRSPLVHEKISAFFGQAPTKNVHPDEAVALGAALLAHSLGQAEGTVTLVDVLPMAIGVSLPGGRFKPVLERNVALPAKKRYELATSREDQQELEFIILQGDSERAVENEYLGTLKVSGLPPGPRGSVRVAITFSVNNEGILQVMAREESLGIEVMSQFSTRDTPTELKAKRDAPSADQPAARRPPVAHVPLPLLEQARHVPAGGLVGWLKRLLGKA
ncbi:TIGR02266 family protein [Melittangium boletus]|uniref:2-alkenal reductase n=1 Tax=Melittangium boletus DSM 14713 TaxID=1294270 RepID=A0A250IR19_9BACT|nr:TIGR02266 family protein [Melittangium boletus]ATB33702.1 2-alkenal reductase [Melittangium boletus DSM 14713]